MLVTVLPVVIDLKDSVDRPKGLHVSQIIGDICKQLYPDVYGQALNVEKVTAGRTFEDWLERGFQEAQSGIFRPPPLQVDGVWLSPDGVNPDPYQIEEYKLTWYSSTDWDPGCKRAWPWKIQIMAYCYALGVTEARLTVFFVNGNYKPPKPEVRQYQLTFTELELQETWLMLINHATAKGWL